MVEFLSHKVVWQPSDNVPGWVRGSDLLNSACWIVF